MALENLYIIIIFIGIWIGECAPGVFGELRAVRVWNLNRVVDKSVISIVSFDWGAVLSAFALCFGWRNPVYDSEISARLQYALRVSWNCKIVPNGSVCLWGHIEGKMGPLLSQVQKWDWSKGKIGISEFDAANYIVKFFSSRGAIPPDSELNSNLIKV